MEKKETKKTIKTKNFTYYHNLVEYVIEAESEPKARDKFNKLIQKKNGKRNRKN